jgi:hypothetical protein
MSVNEVAFAWFSCHGGIGWVAHTDCAWLVS